MLLCRSFRFPSVKVAAFERAIATDALQLSGSAGERECAFNGGLSARCRNFPFERTAVAVAIGVFIGEIAVLGAVAGDEIGQAVVPESSVVPTGIG